MLVSNEETYTVVRGEPGILVLALPARHNLLETFQYLRLVRY